MVERKEELHKEKLSSEDCNHLVMISDISVSAKISITVKVDYYSQLSSVM